MLPDFIARLLVLLFGYAYPAFECFKAVELYPRTNPQLRFWCQYWVIVAIVTVVERVVDIFISWLPLYAEIKLAFFVYLWYPKRKGPQGTDVVYHAFLRPFVMRYEPQIEQRFHMLRANSGRLLIFYLKNFTDKGYLLFREVLRFTTESSEKSKRPSWWSRRSPKSPEHNTQFFDAAGRDGRPRRRGHK